jgi:hypothetical protein
MEGNSSLVKVKEIRFDAKPLPFSGSDANNNLSS